MVLSADLSSFEIEVIENWHFNLRCLSHRQSVGAINLFIPYSMSRCVCIFINDCRSF